MARVDLEKLRRLLEQHRMSLLQEGDIDVSVDHEGDAISKPDDDAQPLAEMNQVIASNRNRERVEQLRNIEEAFARMRDDPDAFGLCEECDEPISRARLELLPWVRLCIECQSARENDDTPGGRRHLRDYK